MSRVFLSYRRDDAPGYAGRLYDSLTRFFGSEQVFMDVDTLEPGDDFVEVIKDAVGSCDVLVAVIGRQWLSIAGPSGSRRLDDPEDFVRLEIEAALERKVRVVPALVDQASMPRSTDLPGSISALARRQAVELSHSRWEHDVDRLMRAVERAIDGGSPDRTRTGVEPGPGLATPPGTGPPLPGSAANEGFGAEDFAALREGDAAARQRVKERLYGFWGLVGASLSEGERLKLGKLHSAVLGTSDRRASCQTNWGQAGANLTLELAADPASQLELNVVAWTAVPAEAFEGWLRSERGRARVEQLADYELVIYARRAHKGPSGRPYWQQTTYEAIASTPAREADSAWLDEKLSQFRGNVWEKPAFHLRKLWPESEVIKEGESLGPRVAAEVRRLLPLLDEANAPSAVTSSGVPIEGPRGSITSMATWLANAPPEQGEAHWRDGRSAKELARAWLPLAEAGEMPVEVRVLLDSREETMRFTPTRALAEHVTRLDYFRGEQRNHDLVVLGEAAGGRTLLAVEGKADEPLGPSVASYLRSVAQRPGSNAPARVRSLCAAILGAAGDAFEDETALGRLRYQLVHGVAGALIKAGVLGAAQAVFVVHEFLSEGSADGAIGKTDPNLVRENADDLDLFAKALGDREGRDGLRGPFLVPGGARVPPDVPLFIGKATHRLDVQR